MHINRHKAGINRHEAAPVCGGRCTGVAVACGMRGGHIGAAVVCGAAVACRAAWGRLSSMRDKRDGRGHVDGD